MKKTLLLLLICAVVTLNTACSKSNPPKDNDSSINQTEDIEQTEIITNNDASNENSETESEEQLQEKPEAAPEVKPEATPTPKPQVKPSTKPEAKPQPKPQPTPETKPQPETKPEESILKGELKGIIEKVYELSELELPKVGYTEVTSSNSKYYLGTENIKFSEALASEPFINAIAHSVVLLRVDSGSDMDKIKAEIKNNVNPRKWICVGVEEDRVVVDNIDNLIILIMDNESERLHEAFLSLRK